jgi:ABC-2 type transport system ATP-binding protein
MIKVLRDRISSLEPGTTSTRSRIETDPLDTDIDISEGSIPAIVAEHLEKRYRNGVHATRGVSLAVLPGEIVGVVGPNGAGKSTTLNILATLIRPSSGDARICGVSIRNRAAVRPLIGVALQSAGLDPLMSVKDHFEVHAALYGISPRTFRGRSSELIDMFELGPYDDRKAGTLSGGTRRRLSLALAVMHEPRVIILDEPTVGLDPGLRRAVWELLERLRRREMAVILSTHQMDEADYLCQRIELMSQGRIVASGTPDDLKASVSTGVLRLRTVAGADVLANAVAATICRGDLPATTKVEVRGDTVEINVDGVGAHALSLLAQIVKEVNVSIVEVNWGRGSLDDVFTHLAQASFGEEEGMSAPMEYGVHARRGRRGR